jgi:hypothetical protein
MGTLSSFAPLDRSSGEKEHAAADELDDIRRCNAVNVVTTS